MGDVVWNIALEITFVLVGGLFAATEMALVTLRDRPVGRAPLRTLGCDGTARDDTRHGPAYADHRVPLPRPGELAPKRLAIQRNAQFAYAVAPILDVFATIMRSVIWLLSISTNALVRLLGGDPHKTADELSAA